MLAAVLREFGKMSIEDVPTPEPGINEVLVKVKACGICQTDYKAFLGKRDNVVFPKILGHEPAGIVADVGKGVTAFKPGDEVIVQPAGFCGFCRPCRTGIENCCKNRFTIGGDGGNDVRNGSFAEYVVQNASSILHKPKNISFEAAALTEPLAGSWKGLIKYSQMKVGEDVVVVGTGGIGMLVLMLAAAAGAGTAIAVDISDYALNNALKLGATHAINPNKCNVKEKVYEILPDGPDLVIEAAGPVEAVQMMFGLCRRATRINLFGITTHEDVKFDGGYTHFLETRMDSSFSVTPESMMNAAKIIERGLVDPTKIITHRFGLTKINEAMQAMGMTERNKIMIFPDESDI
ncbi:MAG: alcohol dehydrogenase catalytic domain-containing protein [Sedimentisphaerales bacterium]|nr:alcohol dehydrogenase catalytic domain-containing protein [Sedimentisphaerales bacterium]